MDDESNSRLAEIFSSHYDEVLAYCARRVGFLDAEDAAAEVFAVASRRVEEIDWATARPWLYGVARGVLANRVRSHRRQKRLSQRLGALAGTAYEPPDEVVVRRAEAEEAIRSLRKLAHHDREILMLSAWEELDTPEIARALGISVAAAEKRLARAKTRLARALRPNLTKWLLARAAANRSEE